MWNRSTVRRLVEGTKSRIKISNTPRDLILRETSYQKLLDLVRELDSLITALSALDTEMDERKDGEVVAGVKTHRESLAPVLHRLVSDSAHANREGRAINRWSYKKKLHIVCKGLGESLEADIVRLKQIHERIIGGAALSTGVEIGAVEKLVVCQRTVVATYTGECESDDARIQELPEAIELDSFSHSQEPISTQKLNITFPIQVDSPRGCLLILTMVAAFIIFSCLSGIYFTLDKSQGYSMGDAFTLAGYIIAVGALVSTATMARHWPSCRCWRGRRGGVDGEVNVVPGGEDGCRIWLLSFTR